MTKTRRRELARQARRGGYYQQARTLWVRCPIRGCEHRCTADFYPNVSVNKLLDDAVIAHLEDEHEDES